jgi:hypothetical protein
MHADVVRHDTCRIGGLPSASHRVTLRRRRQARWPDASHQDLSHIAEHLIRSLRARLALTSRLAGQSGLFRRLGRTLPTGRLRSRVDLIQPAKRAQ